MLAYIQGDHLSRFLRDSPKNALKIPCPRTEFKHTTVGQTTEVKWWSPCRHGLSIIILKWNQLTAWKELLHDKANTSSATQEVSRTVWNPKVHYYLTFRGTCIVTYSYNKSQRDALFLKFIFDKELYMFWTDLLSIIRSLNTVYTAIGICHVVPS
jgi:hypothetical protein